MLTQWERLRYRLKSIILIGGGTKKRQQQDIDQAMALWEDYKRRKASTPKGAK